jgi:hypothetical protein
MVNNYTLHSRFANNSWRYKYSTQSRDHAVALHIINWRLGKLGKQICYQIKVLYDDVWMPSSRNPGADSRNLYGYEMYRHAAHYNHLGIWMLMPTNIRPEHFQNAPRTEKTKFTLAWTDWVLTGTSSLNPHVHRWSSSKLCICVIWIDNCSDCCVCVCVSL